MPLSLPEPDTEVGARVARRLNEELVGWLTVVDQVGLPQPAPVWFIWEADTLSALIYSPPAAKRHERIRVNPRASLHLNDDGEGHDFVVMTGTLATASHMAPPSKNNAYVEKYNRLIDTIFGSTERFEETFHVPLIFSAARIRTG